MNDHGYGGTQVVIAFLLGAAAGTTVALLLAPAAGRDTRTKIGLWAHDVGERAVRIPGAVRGAAGRAGKAARATFVESLREPTMEKEA